MVFNKQQQQFISNIIYTFEQTCFVCSPKPINQKKKISDHPTRITYLLVFVETAQYKLVSLYLIS